jgi:signal transduction histidine kinase
MVYNNPVNTKTSFIDAVHLVRFAAFLWIGYLAALAIINQSLWDPRQVNFNTLYYYFMLGVVALLCLGLVYWPWIQTKLGRVFLPLIIGIITVLPMLATWGIIRLFPHTPMLDPQGSVLRLIPFFLVGFLLVSWQYRWQYMLLIILVITGLNIFVIWSFPAPAPGPFQGALTATLIQTVVFLAVGFSISYLITRLRKQQQSLQEANTSLTHYASTLEGLTTTRERNRLARELHDTLAHTLSGLSLQLEAVKAYWDVDQVMARSSLEKSLTAARSGLEETRRALKALRASPLDDLGLAPALRVMAEDMAIRNNLALELSFVNNLPVLSPDVEQCTYRIAQEALINAVNHAMAKKLTVELKSIEGKVLLRVQDNGIGFNVEKGLNSGHFGLTGMRERAQIMGGSISIESKPGKGTVVQLVI